ncbi:MAG: hypothetical protein LAP39_11600 [Acidobacteriia bacterium]|nr:hypothetical protein [Terriglobia bacterium]
MLAVTLLFASSPIFAQQEVVTRYDAFVGYSFLNSSKVNLFENGYAMQVGFRPKTWYSLGFDYTNALGDMSIVPTLLPTTLQQQLGGQLAKMAAAGMIPAGYTLAVPTHSTTQTFAVGPQLAYRHFSQVTLFLRPVFAGAIREVATPKPSDPIAKGIVAQLVPSGNKTDWVGFVGFGGGFDILFTHHFALRTQADLVYDHLFNDLLREGRYTVRFAIGPAFNFGKNIAH